MVSWQHQKIKYIIRQLHWPICFLGQKFLPSSYETIILTFRSVWFSNALFALEVDTYNYQGRNGIVTQRSIRKFPVSWQVSDTCKFVVSRRRNSQQEKVNIVYNYITYRNHDLCIWSMYIFMQTRVVWRYYLEIIKCGP
jgi:hypothetical protein